MRRALVILLQSFKRTGREHPQLRAAAVNYTALLVDMGLGPDEINQRLNELVSASGQSDGSEQSGAKGT